MVLVIGPGQHAADGLALPFNIQRLADDAGLEDTIVETGRARRDGDAARIDRLQQRSHLSLFVSRNVSEAAGLQDPQILVITRVDPSVREDASVVVTRERMVPGRLDLADRMQAAFEFGNPRPGPKHVHEALAQTTVRGYVAELVAAWYAEPAAIQACVNAVVEQANLGMPARRERIQREAGAHQQREVGLFHGGVVIE